MERKFRNASFLFLLTGLLFFSVNSQVKAVQGTCSSHGGVDCSAMADSDGSAVCNDGWRDSSETFSSVLECKNLHHSCTVDENNQINQKYDLNNKAKAVSDIANQIISIGADSSNSNDFSAARDQYLKVAALRNKLLPLQADFWEASNEATRECWILGDKEYSQQQADLISQYSKSLQQSKSVQPTTLPPISSLSKECISPNSHYISSTQCVCDTGYFDTNGYCANISDFCILTLGGHGIPTSDSTCGCSAGFSVGYLTIQGTSYKTCIATTQPTVTKAPQVKSTSSLPFAPIVKNEEEGAAVGFLSTTTVKATTSPEQTLQPVIKDTFWDKVKFPFKLVWGLLFK